MRDDLWSGKYLQTYRGSLGVVVDGRDRIVPEMFGRRLYQQFTGPKRLWEFPECGHIQIGSPAGEFWRDVIEFWREANHSK